MFRKDMLRRWIGGVGLSVLCALTIAACSDGAATGPENGGAVAKPDTSALTIVRLTHTAYDGDGTVETGLTLQWRLRFESTTGRDCRIRSYTLRDGQGATVFERLEPAAGYVSDEEELTDKVTWVPIANATSAGTYTFKIAYETGRVYTAADDRRRWVGPLSSASVVETFTAVPINSLD